MPVVKDLVPDLTNFYAQYASIEPWLKTTTPTPQKEWKQSRRRPQEARRSLRVHPVRLLLDLLPQLLVERRPLSRPGRAAAGRPLAQGLARRGDRRTPRQSRRSVPALSLPHHHELREGLPEGPQSGEGNRRDQEDDGRAAGLDRRDRAQFLLRHSGARPQVSLRSLRRLGSEGASPESIAINGEYGFRVRPLCSFGAATAPE